MARRGGGSGDLYARLKVTVPKNLSQEERALIEKLQGLRPEDPRERMMVGK
jgi:DnaJ-class molecular chaperone